MKRKVSKILGIGLSIAMITSLLVAAVPASALSTPDVEVTYPNSQISWPNAKYTIETELGKQLASNGTYTQGFIITFPDEYTLDNGDLAGTVVFGPGWIDFDGVGGEVAEYNWGFGDATNWTANNEEKTITIALDPPGVAANGTWIGKSAEVIIEITGGIDNPDTPGDYTLDVETWDFTNDKKVESPVTSGAFTIGEPMIYDLPGIVLAKNKAGILMSQSNSIITGIHDAGPGGTVEVGPGTYAQDVDANMPGQTIIASGGPGTAIIQNNRGGGGTLTISAGPATPTSKTGVTIDGIDILFDKMNKEDTLVTIAPTASYAKLQNCTIDSGESAAILIAENTTDNNTHTIYMCNISAEGDDPQVAITAEEAVTITDSTITVGAKGTAVVIDDGGVASDPTSMIKGSTISGSSGKGIVVNACGVVTIDDTTLQSLDVAIANSGKVTMKNSVVDTCGAAKPAKGDAIDINDGATVRMYNNTIQNSAAVNWAMDINGTVDIEAHFNNILNNAKSISAEGTANCSHNWWGSVDGPASGVNEGTYLDVTPVLRASVTAASLGIGWDGPPLKSVIAETTVGADVAILDDDGNEKTAGVIGVCKYAGNPEVSAPPIMGTGSILGYYDVYVVDAKGNVRVKFYGAPSSYTKLYYAGGISGIWHKVEGTKVNTASKFLYATIGGTDTGLIPADLAGTAFALVEDKSTTDGPDITGGKGSPVIGAYDVSIEPMFTWGEIDPAIRYEIALSEDPTFTIIEWSYNVDQPFYKVDEPLRYDTTYYWRVRGVLGEPYQEAGQWKTPATPWTVGIFTTASEPEPAPDPIVVNPVKPEVNVEIPPTKITIEPAEQAIPNYMLWIIVAVGAILVIALIVLIVRTRRVV
jgi:hypothetical protein